MRRCRRSLALLLGLALLGCPGPGQRGVHETMEFADKLQEEGKHEEAIREYLRAIDLGGDRGWALAGVAVSLDELGRYEEAKETFEAAVEAGAGVHIDAARCISRHEGSERATAWLRRWGSRTLVGEFHMVEGRYEEAIPLFERHVKERIESHGLRFDGDHRLIVDHRRRPLSNEDLTAPWPHLEYLAECCLEVGRTDDAFRYATMSMTLEQERDRGETWLEPVEREVGGVRARLVRAWVFAGRGEWERARSEYYLACVGARMSKYDGDEEGVRKFGEHLEQEGQSPAQVR